MSKKLLCLLIALGVLLPSCASPLLILEHDRTRPNTEVLERAIEMVDLVKRDVSQVKKSQSVCPSSDRALTENEVEVFLGTPSTEVAYAKQTKQNDTESFSIMLDRGSAKPMRGYRYFAIQVYLRSGCTWYWVGFSTFGTGDG